jgi:hypothetical protein
MNIKRLRAIHLLDVEQIQTPNHQEVFKDLVYSKYSKLCEESIPVVVEDDPMGFKRLVIDNVIISIPRFREIIQSMLYLQEIVKTEEQIQCVEDLILLLKQN